MFLSCLSENEKELFLQASLHLSNSDGVFSDDEKTIITTLCNEMMIPSSFEIKQNFESVLTDLAKISDLGNRKKIVFELAGVVMADEQYSDEEKKLMDQISDSLLLDRSIAEQAVALIQDMMSIYKKAALLVQ